MDEGCAEFLDLLAAVFPEGEVVRKAEAAYWSPGEPPVTVLFGDIGRCIAEIIMDGAKDVDERVFLLIEEAMSKDGAVLANAVATGLIEATVSALAEAPSLLGKTLSRFGPLSRAYIGAWIAT